MRPIRPLRRFLNKQRVAAFLSSHPDIRRAQATVASSTADPFYRNVYRIQEAHYWLPVPDWLQQDFASQPPARCLDIGCGFGTLAVYCKLHFGSQVFGTDFYAGYFSPALGQTVGIDFAVQNVELEPLPWQGPFDVILMTEVLEHFNFHPLPTLQKIRQALAPGGRLYLTTPDAQEWGRQENVYASLEQIPLPDPRRPILDRHIYIYFRDELVDLVQAAGFQVLRCSYAPGIQYHHHALTLAAGDSENTF